MLLLPVADGERMGALLALSSTLAGNLIVVGSIANIIVLEQARAVGITVVYAGALTLALVFLTDKFFGFRLNEKDERVGMDGSLHGENAYGLLNLH